MLKTIEGLQGVTVLSKEAQKKIGGGATQCGVVNRFSNGNRCVELVGSKTEAIAAMNQLHQDIQSDNGEGNWYSAESAGWCCASCSSIPKCSNSIYF